MEMPYVHLGILVHDLEAAMPQYEKVGFTFMEPLTVHVDDLHDEDGERREIDLRIVFALEGPPHLELLEVTGNGIYGPQHVGGLHHIAVLTGDPAARRDELVRAGFRFTAAQYRPDGSMIVGYADPAHLDGVRIELLDAPVHDTIGRWIAGDETAKP